MWKFNDVYSDLDKGLGDFVKFKCWVQLSIKFKRDEREKKRKPKIKWFSTRTHLRAIKSNKQLSESEKKRKSDTTDQNNNVWKCTRNHIELLQLLWVHIWTFFIWCILYLKFLLCCRLASCWWFSRFTSHSVLLPLFSWTLLLLPRRSMRTLHKILF